MTTIGVIRTCNSLGGAYYCPYVKGYLSDDVHDFLKRQGIVLPKMQVKTFDTIALLDLFPGEMHSEKVFGGLGTLHRFKIIHSLPPEETHPLTPPQTPP